MPSPDHEAPSAAAMAAAVAPLVAAEVGTPATVRLITRRPNPCFSSSRTEIVTIAGVDGGERDLFLKYDREPDPEPRYRQGIAYCGRVYEQLVRRLPLPSVRCLGLVTVGHPPVRALVLEHVPDCLRVNEASDESGVLAAAAWCGRMHAWGGAVADDPALGFLGRYSVDSCRAWSRRARLLATAVGGGPAWLARTCDQFDARVGALVAMERTTIHGEFGPQNVLWKDGVVRPVDWESAAIGPGVIDLAALLFDWPPATVRQGVDAYWRARAAAPPDGFAEILSTATLLTALRWLPAPVAGEDAGWREGLARLERAAAGTLG